MGYRVHLGGIEDYDSINFRTFLEANVNLAKKYNTTSRGVLKDLWLSEYGGTVITKSVNGHEKWVAVEFDCEADYFLFMLKTVQ